MTDDDLLREASDPTTPGERLRELSDELSNAVQASVRAAAVRNPNLPLDELCLWLSSNPSKDWEPRMLIAAWHNPAVPALLVSEPSPEYAATAVRVLQRLSRGESYDERERIPTLAEAVALWSKPAHGGGLRERGDGREARDFARHLAGLFGLPWAQEAT